MTGSKYNSGRLFVGCLIAILVAVLLVGGFVGFFFYGRSKLTPYCEEYFKKVERGDYRGAYKKAGNRWKKEQNLEQFSEFERTARGMLGKSRERRVTGIYISKSSGMTTAEVTYAAKFEKGDCDIIFSLEKIDDEWFVQGVEYISDVLQPMLRCPHCGALQGDLGKFCSECGEPMRPKSASDQKRP